MGEVYLLVSKGGQTGEVMVTKQPVESRPPFQLLKYFVGQAR